MAKKRKSRAGRKQTVIVPKSHPKVKGRKSAAKVARKFADRIYTARETETSYRFRQRPPDCFVRKTFRTVCYQNGVCVVYGKPRVGARKRRSCR